MDFLAGQGFLFLAGLFYLAVGSIQAGFRFYRSGRAFISLGDGFAGNCPKAHKFSAALACVIKLNLQ